MTLLLLSSESLAATVRLGLRHRPADAGTSTDDQDHTVIQQPCHSSSFLKTKCAGLSRAFTPEQVDVAGLVAPLVAARPRDQPGRGVILLYIAAIRAARRRANGVVGSGVGWAGRPCERGSHQSYSSAPI